MLTLTNTEVIPKNAIVDEYPEYIDLGPHPLMEVSYAGGNKNLQVKKFL
jgi:hypothetical protein